MKLLSTLIAAAFAIASFSAVADSHKADMTPSSTAAPTKAEDKKNSEHKQGVKEEKKKDKKSKKDKKERKSQKEDKEHSDHKGNDKVEQSPAK